MHNHDNAVDICSHYFRTKHWFHQNTSGNVNLPTPALIKTTRYILYPLLHESFRRLKFEGSELLQIICVLPPTSHGDIINLTVVKLEVKPSGGKELHDSDFDALMIKILYHV